MPKIFENCWKQFKSHFFLGVLLTSKAFSAIMLKFYFLSLQLLLTTLFLECSSHSYFNKNLHTLCNPSYQNNDFNKKIFLSKEEQSMSVRRRIGESKSRRSWNNCTVTIETEKEYFAGIYLNIIDMGFRQEKWAKINEDCIDHIIVKYNGTVTKKFCGHLDYNQIISLEDYSGKIEITILIDRSVPFYSLSYTDEWRFSEFEIVATAFGKCIVNHTEFACKKNDSNSCIHGNFFGDKIENCICPECLDEKPKIIVDEDTKYELKYSYETMLLITALIIIATLCTCCVCHIYNSKSKQPAAPRSAKVNDASKTTTLRRHSAITSIQISTPNASVDGTNARRQETTELPPTFNEFIITATKKWKRTLTKMKKE